MDKEKLSNILLGGAGGAIVAAVIAVFFSMYQESIRNSEKVEAMYEILSAKKQVMEEIWKAREEERSHLIKAINHATIAKVESNAALSDAKESLLYIKEQRGKVDQFVGAIEKGSGVSVKEIAESLEVAVVDQLLDSFSKNAVVAFNSLTCPDGWREFEPAYGRFIRGIDKSGLNIDPKGNRPPGDIQEDSFEEHNHPLEHQLVTHGGKNPNLKGGGKYRVHWKKGNELTTANKGGTETRPKNVSLLYCIRN